MVKKQKNKEKGRKKGGRKAPAERIKNAKSVVSYTKENRK